MYVCSFLTHPALFSVYPACLPAFLLLQGLLWALGHALTTLKSHREDFRAMQRRGMERDASWDLAAQQYEQVFEWALVSGRGREGKISTFVLCKNPNLYQSRGCRLTHLTASKKVHGSILLPLWIDRYWKKTFLPVIRPSRLHFTESRRGIHWYSQNCIWSAFNCQSLLS